MAKESNFRNMTLTLLVISFFASASLAVVYVYTKTPIELAQQAKITNAIKNVLPEFDNQPASESYQKNLDGGVLTVYPATKAGKPVGNAVKTFSNNGFGGLIELMVGFDTSYSITGIAVISHKETPGLGDKMEASKSNFSVQFQGKNPENFKVKVKKDGGDVDAITASTISSRAFCDAVQRAYNALRESNDATSGATAESKTKDSSSSNNDSTMEGGKQ